ncbi:MAG: SDR family oxidoreductase [Nitratireductor sp.]
MRLMIFGAGYSGRAIARHMRAEAEWVAGTTRSPENFDRLRAAGIEPLVFDGETSDPELRERLSQATHLVVSIAPKGAADPVLAAFADFARRDMPELAWIGYLSTIGVYGDHDGAWVDEDTTPRPVSPRSVARVAAEEAWLALGRERSIPAATLRLSGIYGPGRNALLNLSKGTARRLVKRGQVFNRIHVADIAGATAHLARAAKGGLFNVTDDEPAPPQDVVEFAAETMGIAPPPEIPFAEAELSPMARSFWAETKRVSNARIKTAGYRFAYPDYRAALTGLWRDGAWDIEPGA